MKSNNNKNKPLLERRFWSVTWPIVIDLSLGMGLMFTDFIFLSQVSDSAAAAVGAVLPIIHITGTLYFPLGQGCSSVLGQTLGAKRFEDVGRIHGVSLLLSICLGLLLFAVMLQGHHQISELLGLEGELLVHASQYLHIISLSFLFICVQKVLASILRSHGRSDWVMYSAIIINGLNLIANTVLLYGFVDTGLTSVQNVALATVIASFVGMVWCFIGVYKELEYKIIYLVGRNAFFDTVKKIMKISAPGTIEPLNYQVCQAALVMMIIPLGAIAVATRAYVNTFLILVMVFELGIAIATSIFIAHHFGAKEFVQANNRLKKNVIQAMAISGVLNLLLFLLGGLFLGLFTQEQGIIDLGTSLLLVGLFWGPAKAVNVVIGNSLRACGDAMFSSYIGISMWVVGLPLAYFLGYSMAYGLVGVWIAMTIDENLRAFLHFMRWEYKFGKKSEILYDQTASD
jgi:putative MATE family efflux protein